MPALAVVRVELHPTGTPCVTWRWPRVVPGWLPAPRERGAHAASPRGHNKTTAATAISTARKYTTPPPRRLHRPARATLPALPPWPAWGHARSGTGPRVPRRCPEGVW